MRLIEQVQEVTGKSSGLEEQTTNELKDILENAIANKKKKIISKQIKELKEYKNYADVMDTFDDIKTMCYMMHH